MRRSVELLITLMLITVSSYAQEKVVPGSKEYQLLKQQGKLIQPAPVPRQRNYPTLRDARQVSPDKQKMAGARLLSASNAQLLTSCSIEQPELDPSFNILPSDDDGSSARIPLQFTFNLFGVNYNHIYVNINGNVTFGTANGVYSSSGFPSEYDMVAPFWADVDTRGVGSGQIYYKSEPNRFTVVWDQVGYYDRQTSKLNTFKLVIADGTDPSIGVGNNVGFFYGDMQWTTGDASQLPGGGGGLGGIPASVGLSKGTSDGGCFYFQLGRFGKAGTEYVDATSTSGVDYLDNKCFFFDASTIETIAFDLKYTKLLCAVDFELLINNPHNCGISYYNWDLGDGTTEFSTDRRMIHSYNAPGTYTVSVEITYGCGACNEGTVMVQKQITIDATEDAMLDTLLKVTTDIKQQVLSTTISTFSDAWTLQQSIPGLNEKHGFLNGTEGVWRNEGSYVYEVPRKLSSPPNLATDGTFSMDQFSWESADIDAIPNWIKVNTITNYSPFSYETENKDVLDVHTAALYDYGGHLPSANGVNMRHNEMAFTGFEFLDGKSSGNWVFGNQPLPQYYIYPTLLSYKNIAVVKASLQELENVEKVDVTGRTIFPFFMRRRTRTINDNEIICMRTHPNNPDWSLIVLREALFNFFWIGEIRVKNEIFPIISPDIDQTFAHTGRSSLKITAEKTFKQQLLRLDSGKSYMLNAWVSVNNPHVTTPKLADNLGVDVMVKDKLDVLLATFSFQPVGRVIEGWQQVKGVFTCPDKGTYLELKFKPGTTGTAWYDDLRLHPNSGNMRSYVYDLNDYRLRAILDEENFASFFYYDQEGNLYLTQKETEEGVKTITENVSYQVETN